MGISIIPRILLVHRSLDHKFPVLKGDATFRIAKIDTTQPLRGCLVSLCT